MIRPGRQADRDGGDESQRQRSGVGSRQRRAGDLLRPVGRFVLWAAIAVILIRGVGAAFSSPVRPQAAAPTAPTATPLVADQESQAFADGFARAYLSFSANRLADWTRGVASYLASGLSDRAAAVLPRTGPGQQVAQATVARVVSLGGTRALITVACSFTDPSRPARYLTVPVARDTAGGLSVFDLPALSAPPPKGSVAFAEPPPLTDPDAGVIQQLVGRFLGAYLSGQDPSGLAYLLAPGASVPRLGAGLALVSVDALGQEGEPTASSASVEAAVHVRDTHSGVVYPLRYRLSLVHRDRWYVSSLAGGSSA